MRAALVRGLRAYGALVGNKRAAQLTADGRDGRRLCTPLRVPARPAVPGADQGASGLARGRAPGRERAGRSFRTIGSRPIPPPPTSCSSASSSARRSGSGAGRTARSPASARPARRGCRASSPIARARRRRAPRSSWSRAIRRAAPAKQARNRETQAVLPLRGKILNVASASADKLRGNKELDDLVQALGCGIGARFDAGTLRYERVIIMTDADVDGAHIAALLMTFFYRQMPGLIDGGNLFLAQPPLYRLARGRHHPLCARRCRSRPAARKRLRRRRQGRDQPFQGPRRDAAGATQGNHDGPGPAHAAARRDRRARGRGHGPPGRGADGPPPRNPASPSSRRAPIR